MDEAKRYKVLLEEFSQRQMQQQQVLHELEKAAEAWMACEMKQMLEREVRSEKIFWTQARHIEMQHCVRRMIDRTKQLQAVFLDSTATNTSDYL